MSYILVTGQHGYIGSRLVQELTKLGHYVISFNGDVTRLLDWYENVKYVVPRAIIHLAAMNDLRKCEQDPDESFRVNYMSAIYAGYIAQIYGCRLIFTSTTTAGDFNTIYETDRYNAEMALCHMRGLYGAILRLATVYGDSPIPTSPERGIINRWMDMAKSGMPLKVYREVANLTRDYVYVNDVVNRIIQAIDTPNGVYDVCTGKAMTILNAATEIANLYHGSVELIDAGQLYPVELRNENIQNARLVNGDTHWTSFRDGLKMMVNAG